MKAKKSIIGILAGMGPKSTSPFLDLLIEQCQKQYGAKNDIDFPHILIYSLPTPFYVNKKIDDKEMEKTICAGLKKLENAGANFISMPCNIAHKYFNQLEKCIKIPLLNIVTSTTKRIRKTSRRVTIFATKATVESNIYQNAIKNINATLILKNEWQFEISNLIQAVKDGQAQGKLVSILRKLSKSLKGEKIDIIIIACTDISKIVRATIKDIKLIDSSEALAEETVKKYLKRNHINLY